MWRRARVCAGYDGKGDWRKEKKKKKKKAEKGKDEKGRRGVRGVGNWEKRATAKAKGAGVM